MNTFTQTALVKTARNEFYSQITRRYTIIGVLLGIVLLAVAWVLQFVLSDLTLSLAAIWDLHKAYPALFLIDLLPLIFGVMLYYIARRYERLQQDKQHQLEEKEQIIERNVNLARKIGNREASIDANDIPEEDPLAAELWAMRQNMELTNQKEADQNWISKGKDLISNVLRQYNTLEDLAYQTLKNFIEYIGAVQGAFYIYDEEEKTLTNSATYAYNRRKYKKEQYKMGEGLIGEAAYELDIIYRREIPDDYVTITSGILGDQKPRTLLILPLISDEKLQGIIEVASLQSDMPQLTIRFARELGEIIGQTVFNLKVNKRTERLLQDSQRMTSELQQNEEELRKNAIEMQKAQKELERTNKDLEEQIEEVENAQKRLYTLLENASEVISIIDKNGLVIYESPSVKHILGYNPDDSIGKNIFEEYDNQAYRKIKDVFQNLLDNPNEQITFEYTYRKDENTKLYIEATGRNLLDNPAINGIIFNARDITVRKIAEQAEKRSGQMQALSENSPDMIIRLNANGEFFYVNPVVEQITGILTNSIVNRTISEVSIQKEISDVLQDMLDNVKESSEKQELETTFPTLQGERVMVVNGIPEFNEESEVESILFTAHDITDLKKIEEEIRAKNKAINDSINYAQRIQTAILPDNQLIREYLPSSFIYYEPRDVVSGDFPWFVSEHDYLHIAAVDCTGHGVPGAMLSFIGYFQLNNIVSQHPEDNAAQILDKFHLSVRKALRQEQPNASARDGMDIAFCKIDKENKTINYAGAHRPLYQLRNGELTSYKGDPKAIGGIPHRRKKEKPFTNYEIKYQAGDKFFFFSDGLPDQIGGEKGRKYKPIRVREMILNHSNYTMEEFHHLFKQDFSAWKGDNKQIDDVLLIGIEF